MSLDLAVEVDAAVDADAERVADLVPLDDAAGSSVTAPGGRRVGVAFEDGDLGGFETGVPKRDVRSEADEAAPDDGAPAAWHDQTRGSSVEPGAERAAS